MQREFITGAADKLLSKFSANSSGNAPVLLSLGGFKFSLNTAAFQRVERVDAFRWRAQERVGLLDALQYTGPENPRVELPGVVYPDFRGGLGQVDQLRALARQGKPLNLLTGSGANLGAWVIERVEEVASEFKPDGTPRKQEFSVSIRKFSDAANV